MKRNMIVLSLLFMVALSGCSNGISQSDYDQVVAEKESIQKEYDTLQKSYEKLKTECTDLLDEKMANMEADLPNQYAQAWADTYFSGEKACFIYGDTLFVSVLTEKAITQENVKGMWDELLSSITGFAAISKQNPDSFPYKRISISFYDFSGAGIVQYVINTNGTLQSVSVNSMYANEIASWLQ